MSAELYLDHSGVEGSSREIAFHGEDYRTHAGTGQGLGGDSWGDTSLIRGFVAELDDCPLTEVRQRLAALVIQTGDDLNTAVGRSRAAETANWQAARRLEERP
ncbi:hypothetical protein [Streptosporangium sp. NBC_01756]|uniref:hypothetical protein n=1 Tax=Streptosporangium sp. NBC_01756 TaxID=2975950 RepID=UPI002DDC243F|nr:hypothetical protein [Streptosporangium sp. NBC_01756]WSC88940.1 hypothetical protein OIE48_12355 [Streptosporangium sp. NBC_01756]